MQTLRARRMISVFGFLPVALMAQAVQDVAPLRHWPAPLYWQPSEAEARSSTNNSTAPRAQSPASTLIFIAITPCRLVDTRAGSGFTGLFGAPGLVGGASRTFPIQSSPNCPVPSIAQAYSFNVTVVPPGFLGFIT